MIGSGCGSLAEPAAWGIEIAAVTTDFLVTATAEDEILTRLELGSSGFKEFDFVGGVFKDVEVVDDEEEAFGWAGRISVAEEKHCWSLKY